MFRMRSFAGLPLALWVVVALLLPLVASGTLLRVTAVRAQSSDLVITGVIDGPLSGGVPKAIELYALNNISDLSIYGLESANNGNPAGGPEFTFPADTVSVGEFLYVASEEPGFMDFFGFAPDYTGGVAGINGDDAIALYQNGTIVDVFGEIGVDGTGQPWEYADGWAYRVDGTGPDGNTFGLSNWTFSGPNALDGEISNSTAATPFPIGMYGTGGGGDTPPTISSAMPADSATDVAVDTNIVVTFSEPVTVAADWLSLSCPSSGNQILGSAGSGTSFTLDPSDVANGETCMATIESTKVTDQDGTADNLAANFDWSFTTIAIGTVCGDPATLISAIQGDGTVGPLEGQTHTVEGIVVGDFQEGDNDDTPELPGYDSDLDGFYVQEENSDWDADPATSEGIFVFTGNADVTIPDVEQGEIVRVTGVLDEFFDLTELTNVGTIEICGSTDVPTPTDVLLPVATLDEFERYEGMLVRFPQSLVIAEYFNFDRFGEIVLAQPLDDLERPFQPTSYVEPGPAVDPVADAIERSRITLDDARSSQNPDPARHPNGAEFTLDNRFRGGDTVQNAVGVLDYRFGKYRIQPTQDADYTLENPRPAAPEDVGGSLTVAGFNVLNYFTTFGSRGADNQEEFERQRDKIIAALAAIDADIVGLIEIENNTAALQDLVSGLNNAVGAGTYDYIETGMIGTDAIKVAFIYKPGSITPIGEEAVLDTSEFVSPNTTDPKNRPALAQTFAEDATGGVFTVVVNHFKSKGSSCGVGDDDPQQGNCNLTRTLAAQELVDWLATDPTGSNDPDVMIIGDLNAYDEEDPIDAIKAGADDILGTADDYTDLIELYAGEFAYSFVFDGQFGYLDYALVNQALLPQVTGTTEWYINADEPDILDYDTTFKQDAQDVLYEPNPYRSSDHDPVIVGLNLESEAEPIEPLTLTSICNAADGSHQWRVRNPNDFDVSFTWQLYGTGETGADVAPAGSDTFFFTPTAGTVKISWDNNGTPAETVKAANNESCTLPTGNITIVKQATPAAPWLDWTFDGDLGAFTLDNDSRDDAHLDHQTFEVAAGSYTVNETNKRGNWDLEIVCESSTGESTFAADGTAVMITPAAGDDVTCTYNNLRRPQIRITKYADTNGNGERDADEAGLPGRQMFLYLADGNGGWTQIQSREVRTNGRGIANYTSLEPGVDHLVCEAVRDGWSTTEPVNPIEHDGKICQVVADLVYGEVRRVSFGNREEPPAQTLYRARQVGARVWIERNVAEAGLGDFDPDGNGWALVGRTNGAADNGELRDFFVEEGVPYAIVFNRSNNKGDRCIRLIPRSLDGVKKGQTRLMTTVEDPVSCPAE